MREPAAVQIDTEKLAQWTEGAIPSVTVRNLIKKHVTSVETAV